jgi:tetratricopeptide (TPR) repeat protein
MADVPGKFMMPSRLGFPGSFRTFCLSSSFTGSFEIDSSITQLQHLISIFPRSEPRRLEYVLTLGSKRIERHTLSGQREDLDKAILHFTESILLLPLSWLQDGPVILRAFFCLAYALFERSNMSGQPEDAICATKYLFHLREQPHEIPWVARHRATTLLVDALALQVRLEAGNVMENIRQLAVLSRELITLDTSDLATDLIKLIHDVVTSNIHTGVPDQPLDELVECLRTARKQRPDLLDGHVALAVCLGRRYYMTNVDDDYEDAVSILDEIANHNSTDKSVTPERGLGTALAATLAKVRSDAYQSPEYLEEAIYRTSACSSSASFLEHYQSVRQDPEVTAKKRFQYFGSIEGVESSGTSPLSQPAASDNNRTKSRTADEMKYFLFVIRNSDDTTTIDEAVEKGRSIIPLDPDTHTLVIFADILDTAFDRTKKIKYLDESISVRRQIIESPLPQAVRSRILPDLSRSLLARQIARSRLFPGYSTHDLDEGLEILSHYVSTPHASLPDRFRYACIWTLTARFYQHPTVSKAYETALSLMQDTLLFSPTLQLQHSTLASLASAHSLPLDYASYQLELYQLEKAIEILERGRALLWSEMRRLRAPIDQLLEADPDLGHKFATVNRDLEEVTKSVSPSHKLSLGDGTADGLRAVDPFGHLVMKQCGLLKERDKLISQIQALPGFDSFLESPSYDTLRSVAFSGPVIIINHSTYRSDILVLLHHLPPSLIPTPSDFFERASALKDKLLESRRKFGLDSTDYEQTLAFVLEELYKLVGKPVIDQLRLLRVPEQSRVWWCPASVFCSLPLHAMGPIPSDDGEVRYFLDLYISSYTLTLSALLQSRKRDSGPRSLDRPYILLVAQPDLFLPTVEEEIQVIQALDTEVSSLISDAATPATAIDGFHHHQFVHFACHGTLATGKPFEAGFELHGGARLTLLEIVRSHLPTAEFAFLSACHTAEVTEGSIMDEGLHLAAAIQYCGFRSVVGTMWAMADEDGQDLAKYFYKALFSGSRGIPYHEKSAKALRFAVKKLRRKRGVTLERWVNFVHYGA